MELYYNHTAARSPRFFCVVSFFLSPALACTTPLLASASIVDSPPMNNLVREEQAGPG
jgi:hypothetical protein